MVRTIAAVVVGYLVMALLIFAMFSAAYLTMGADAAFRPGTFEVSGLWLATSFVLGLVAAVIGGYVCATIAQGGKAPLVLAALTLALGVLLAVPVLTSGSGQPLARSGDVPNLDAMQQARQPGWVALLNPLIGAAGVLAGARLKRTPLA